MANNDYLDSLNKLTRKRQLNLVKEQQQAIYKAYDMACSRYYEKFLDTWGNNTATHALNMEYAREMAIQLDSIIKEYNIKASENSLAMIEDMMSGAYDDHKLTGTPYAKAVSSIAQVCRDRAARRIILGDIYKDGKGLSDRIWNAANASSQKINEVVAACMASQMSATEMSKVLQSFMKPGSSTTWNRKKILEKLGPGYAAWNKDLSYEALRLARTTITHAATLALKEGGKVNPYLNSAKWHSVHAIGRTCELCKERDGKVYTLAQLPFDHPNGLCWHEPVLDKSLEEIGKELEDWVNGKPNSRLDEYWKSHGPKDVPVPSKLKQMKPAEPEKGTKEWFNKEFPRFAEELDYHWDEGIRDAIMNAPDFMQEWYRLNQDKLVYAGPDGDGAYYSPSDKWIRMNLVKDLNNPRGKYSTFFHEWGHMLDDVSSQFRSNLSNNQVFYNALKNDYEATLKKFGKGEKPWAYVKNKIIEKQREQGDLASGVHDIYSGFSLNEIRAKWGHSTEYWKRGNQALEIASEAWAHMSSSFTNPERLAIMKEWFPTACDEFESIVKYNNINQLRELSKKVAGKVAAGEV